jgi:hypothetical protein
LEWSAPGLLARDATQRFNAGERASLRLTLDAAEAAPRYSAPQRADQDRHRGARAFLGHVMLGTGGVALLAGTALGIVAWRKTSDLEEACPDKRCSEGHTSELRSARTLADVATVSMGVGVVTVGTGALLLLLPGESGARRAVLDARRVQLGVGWRALQVSGRF